MLFPPQLEVLEFTDPSREEMKSGQNTRLRWDIHILNRLRARNYKCECLLMCHAERKGRCEEKRKAGSLCLHPAEDSPAQSQVPSAFPVWSQDNVRLRLVFVYKETSQTAGPLQGHGERSPEGGAVREENAKEEKESLNEITIWTENACMPVHLRTYWVCRFWYACGFYVAASSVLPSWTKGNCFGCI